MKVILIESIRNLGNISEEVKVKKGFGRYLISSQKALYATKENASLVKSNIKILEEKKNLGFEEAAKILPLITNLEIRFIRECQENLKLFGSVTKKDILTELKKFLTSKYISLHNLRFTVENIDLTTPIKVTGIVEVNVTLGNDNTNIIVNVAPSEEVAISNIAKKLEEQKKVKLAEEQKNLNQDKSKKG